MRHVAVRGAPVILAVLLGAAGLVACSGADDSVEQTQAEADPSGGGSDPDDGTDGDASGSSSGGDGEGSDDGGAPGIPDGGSGGGAPGAPIDIPAITNLSGNAFTVDEVVDIMKERIVEACRRAGYQDLCLVVERTVQGDGEDCEYSSDPPEDSRVRKDSTVVINAVCRPLDGQGETEGETEGEGETDPGTDPGSDAGAGTDAGGDAQATP